MSKADLWNTSVFKTSPVIKQLYSLTRHFTHFNIWPEIDDYKNLFKKHNLNITPVPQSDNIITFEEQYEPRVYLKKELQTRSQNWHDFFNAMIWLRFPETKKILNQLHYNQANKRFMGSNRSRLENRITQFDECGAILIFRNEHLLKMIKQHQWQQLFIDNTTSLEKDFDCIIFGHAIYEKALSPYIGLTCHCLMIVDDKLLKDVKSDNYTLLDKYLAELWEHQLSQQDIQFQPFPILGMPGYWPEQDTKFYQNENYFRKLQIIQQEKH